MNADATRMALDLPVPEATEAQHIGRNWQAPPPRRMWQEEIDDPLLSFAAASCAECNR